MIEFKNILFVIGGSAAGGGCRYLLSIFIQQFNKSKFPLATFSVNVIGCFLIGIIYVFAERHPLTSQNMKILLATGFCGGFTTFSAFAIENIELYKNGNNLYASIYILSSIIIGIAATWVATIIFK